MKLRKHFRFSLRTFLIVTTLLGVWLGIHSHRTLRQRDAVAGIREFGGWVYYDFHYPSVVAKPGLVVVDAEPSTPGWLIDLFGVDCFHEVVSVNLYSGERNKQPELNSRYSDDAMEHLADLPKLESLVVGTRQASPESMVHLSELTNLRYVAFSEAHIGDEGAAHLKKLDELRELYLLDARLTDESMETIGRLPKLKRLVLGGNEFTNRSLELLSNSDQLIELDLSGSECRITDEGLVYLAGMTNLKSLDLEGSRVSDAGLIHFEPIPTLSNLKLGNTNVTWRGADTWKKTLDRSVTFNGRALKR